MHHKSEAGLSGLNLPGNTAIAAVAGQLLFVGAITPHDVDTGKLITGPSGLPPEAERARLGNMVTNIMDERALAQAWTIYQNMGRLLAENGSSLENILRQRLFLSNLDDLPVVERVMDCFLGDQKPATTVVEVPVQGMHPGIALQIDCIALKQERGGDVKETIRLPGRGLVDGRYPHATRAGHFIFVSNLSGVNPATGKPAESAAELGEDMKHFANQPLRRSRDEAILAQSWFIFQNMDEVLRSQGASLADILKVNGWLGLTMREFSSVLAVRRVLFPTRDTMPASASIGINAVPREGAYLGYDCIAIVPGDGYRKEAGSDPAELVAVYLLSSRGGPLVFTCGEVPIDATAPKVIRSFEDLDDEGRFLPYARLHQPSPIQARAWFVYKKNQSYLAAHGATFADVVHQTVFMCNPADYPALERVATLFYGPKVPPTTLIPITDTSPYPEAQLEIEMIAAVPG